VGRGMPTLRWGGEEGRAYWNRDILAVRQGGTFQDLSLLFNLIRKGKKKYEKEKNGKKLQRALNEEMLVTKKSPDRKKIFSRGLSGP